MGVHIEVQDEQEVMHVKSRELQLKNTEKLNTLIPVVEAIDNVDLNKIESHTTDIKNMVSSNLEEQPDLQEILKEVQKINKNLSTVKGQVTKLSKEVKEISESIKEMK